MSSEHNSQTVINAIASEMQQAGVSQIQVVNWKYQQLSLFDKQFAPIYNSAVQQLVKVIPDKPCSVTEIGEKLGKKCGEVSYSAIKINQIFLYSALVLTLSLLLKLPFLDFIRNLIFNLYHPIKINQLFSMILFTS